MQGVPGLMLQKMSSMDRILTVVSVFEKQVGHNSEVGLFEHIG